MSVNAHGGENELPQRVESNRPSEKGNGEQAVSKNLMKDLSPQEHELALARQQKRQDPIKALLSQSVWRKDLGECSVLDVKFCGKQDVAVGISNGLPERLATSSQSWERDAKDPRTWHVETGDERFSLKADVRVKDNDVTAKVKYDNGREASFVNGVLSQIHHPDGEVWTANREKPGVWNVVTARSNNSEGARFQIQNVQVNLKDGDIKWQVDKGAGAGHQREIDAHGKYHDMVQPKPVPPGEISKLEAVKTPERIDVLKPEERAARANEAALQQLPKISANTLSFPSRLNYEPSLNALPVARPMILSTPVLAVTPDLVVGSASLKSESAHKMVLPEPLKPRAIELAQGKLPEPSPISLPKSEVVAPLPVAHRSEAIAPLPVARKSELVYAQAPEPLAIKLGDNSAPAPVPMGLDARISPAQMEAPKPVRPQHSGPAPVEITPSTPKQEIASSATQGSAEAFAKARMQEQAPAQEFDKTRMQGQVPAQEMDKTRMQGHVAAQELDRSRMQGQASITDKQNASTGADYSATKPVYPVQEQAPPQSAAPGAPPHLFKFSASVSSDREPSVYDKGPQMVEDSTQKIQLKGASPDHANARLHGQAGHERAEQNILMGGSGMVQLANVGHRVEITVSGVLPNQGYYEATLKNPARGHDGKVLPNQVSWVSGKIVNGSFQIEQARINNGKPFSTIGHLSLRPQRSN